MRRGFLENPAYAFFVCVCCERLGILQMKINVRTKLSHFYVYSNAPRSKTVTARQTLHYITQPANTTMTHRPRSKTVTVRGSTCAPASSNMFLIDVVTNCDDTNWICFTTTVKTSSLPRVEFVPPSKRYSSSYSVC